MYIKNIKRDHYKKILKETKILKEIIGISQNPNALIQQTLRGKKCAVEVTITLLSDTRRKIYNQALKRKAQPLTHLKDC